MEMSKAYIRSSRSGDSSEARRRDYVFAESLREGRHWDTRESAQHDCDTLEASHIELRLLDGSVHVCSGFQVEELAPDDYVIAVEAPFSEMVPMKEKH